MGLKRLLIGSLLIGTFFACSINNVNYQNTNDIYESCNDEKGLEGIILNRKSVIGDDKLAYSKIYTQYGMSSDGDYVLRFATAIKGDIESLKYTRGEISEFQLSETIKEVTVVYRGIVSNDEVVYFDGNDLTNNVEFVDTYYWACYTIALKNRKYDNASINISLSINGDVVTSTQASLNNVLFGKDTKYYTLEAENAVLSKGSKCDLKINRKTTASNTNNSPENDYEVYVGEMNENKGASIEFRVNSSENVKASLFARINKRKNQTVFGDLIDISVNNNSINSREVVESSGSAETWTTFTDINVAIIDLQKGLNTIKFTTKNLGSTSGYNFDNIKLLSKTDVLCGELCSECHKCLLPSCPVCLEKCDILDGNLYKYETEEALLAGGAKIESKNPNIVGGISSTLNASMTYTINALEDTEAILIVAPTQRDFACVFTRVFKLEINGKEYHSAGIIHSNKSDWFNSIEVKLGHIHLIAGDNTIKISVATNSRSITPNFDYISLLSAVELN